MVVNGKIDERHFFSSLFIMEVEGSLCVGWNHWLCACQTETVGVTNVAEKRLFLTERKQLLADDDTSYSVIDFIQTVSILHEQYTFFTISLSVLFMNLLPAMLFRHSCVCIKLITEGYYYTTDQKSDFL